MQCMNEHLISLLKQSVFILIAKMFSLFFDLCPYVLYVTENNLLNCNQFETV